MILDVDEAAHLMADEAARAYEIRRAVREAAAPDDPLPPAAQWTALIDRLPRGMRRLHWLSAEGYAGLLVDEEAADARLELAVHPSARRRGLGSALLRSAARAAGRLGHHGLVGSFADEPGHRFALAHGAVLGNRTVRSVLTLPAAGSARPVAGYTVVSWLDRTPEELLESYAKARDAMNDAPHTGEHRMIWTPSRVRDLEETVLARGRRTRVTAALSGGAVVAFTEMRVSPPPETVVSTEDTATVAAHRGRGLAGWVKAVALAELCRDHPAMTRVVTGNDEQNAPMLAVNRALGFRPVAVWTDAVLPLP